MDTLPYDNVEELACCINSYVKEDSSEQIKAKETLLKMKEEDIFGFIDSVFSLFPQESALSAKYTDITAKACEVLSTMLFDETDEDKIYNKAKDYIFDTCLRTLSAPEISFSVKKYVQPLLTRLFQLEQKMSEWNLRNRSLSIIKEKINTGIFNDYILALLIMRSRVFADGTLKEKNPELFIVFCPDLSNAAVILSTKIMAEIIDYLASPSSQEIYKNIIDGLDALWICISILKVFLWGLSSGASKKKASSASVRVLTSQGSLVEAIGTILNITILTTRQLPSCIFSLSGILEIDEKLNEIKRKAMKFLNKIMELTFKSQNLRALNNNRFLPYARNIGMQLVLQSVLIFCENIAIDIYDAIENPYLEGCVAECLKFIDLLVPEAAVVFSYQRVIINVCLPLIKTQRKELGLFESDPKAFVDLAIDTCDNQKKTVPKTAAAQLLELICDNIDGAVDYVFKLMLAILEYSFLENDVNKISLYPILFEHRDSLFIARTDATSRVETCLVVLTFMAYLVCTREELMAMLEPFLASFSDYLYSEKTHRKITLIKSRLCLFIGYYLDLLFKTDANDLLNLQIEFILKCLQGEKVSADSEQAGDSLMNIIQDKESKPKLEPHINEIIEVAVSYAKITKNPDFFTIYQEIFSRFAEIILASPDKMRLLLKALLDRLQIEYARGNSDEDIKSQFIEKIWGVFLYLSEKAKYIRRYQNEIENIMDPLFDAFPSEGYELLQENMLVYMLNAMRRTKKVPNKYWVIFRALPVESNIESDKLISWIDTLTLIIKNGLETLNSGEGSILVHLLVVTCIQGLKIPLVKGEESDIGDSTHLFAQLIFQKLTLVSQEDWELMLQTCLEKYSSSDFYERLMFGEIILAAIARNFKLTWDVLLKQGKILPKLMNLFLEKTSRFKRLTSRRFLLLGLCSMVRYGAHEEIITKDIYKIFHVVISLLQCEQYIEQKKADSKANEKNDKEDNDEDDKDSIRNDKINSKKIFERFLRDEDVDDRSDDEYDEEYYDEDDSQNSDENEENEEFELEKMKLFQQTKESGLNFFLETIDLLQKNDKEALVQLNENLSSQKQKYLNNLLLNARKENDNMSNI